MRLIRDHIRNQRDLAFGSVETPLGERLRNLPRCDRKTTLRLTPRRKSRCHHEQNCGPSRSHRSSQSPLSFVTPSPYCASWLSCCNISSAALTTLEFDS